MLWGSWRSGENWEGFIMGVPLNRTFEGEEDLGTWALDWGRAVWGRGSLGEGAGVGHRATRRERGGSRGCCIVSRAGAFWGDIAW